MLFRTRQHPDPVTHRIAAFRIAAFGIAIAGASAATTWGCESGPIEEFTDTTGQTFVAFCGGDSYGCDDVEATGDNACDENAYISSGVVLEVCLAGECRPIACEQSADCQRFGHYDAQYECAHGVCFSESFSWDPQSVDDYCLRRAPRTAQCSNGHDSPPNVAGSGGSGGSGGVGRSCPYPDGDLRCVRYEVCASEDYYGTSCSEPKQCHAL